MKSFSRIFLAWLPLAVAITGICLLVYATVQQNYRQSLNDPQIQMAESIAASVPTVQFSPLDPAHPASAIVSLLPKDMYPMPIDIGKDLTPWFALFGNNGDPVVFKNYSTGIDGTRYDLTIATGVLGGEVLKVPLGVLQAARNSTGKDTAHSYENRVTWQPTPNIRQAIVVVWVPQSQIYVVAGRNMREVENREGQLTTFVALAWLVLLVATFATKAFSKYFA